MLAFVPIYGHPVVLFCTDKRVLQPQNRKEKKEGGEARGIYIFFYQIGKELSLQCPKL